MPTRKFIATVGLAYGDEGKGTITDWLARYYEASLVVRYNGGAQAYHTVYDGSKKHIFRQFGSGTLSGARTILGPQVVVNPLTMIREAAELRKLGVVNPLKLMTVDANALVVTPYHRALNVIREHMRVSRHGSTGMGIGEVRHISLEAPHLALRVRDFDLTAGSLARKLAILRIELHNVAIHLGASNYAELAKELSNLGDTSEWRTETLAELYQVWAKDTAIETTPNLKLQISACPTHVVFEGAQGVLLDQHHGFHPHTTWSNTTALHAFELIPQLQHKDVEVIGITRTFTTRHGLGPLVTEGRMRTGMIEDDDNEPGTYQGRLRCGALDAYALSYAMKICQFQGCDITQLAVTHCDKFDGHMTWPVCFRYENEPFVPLKAYCCPEEAGDLATQFTTALMKSTPLIEDCKTYKVLDVLSEYLDVPIAVKSYGKSSENKIKLL